MHPYMLQYILAAFPPMTVFFVIILSFRVTAAECLVFTSQILVALANVFMLLCFSCSMHWFSYAWSQIFLETSKLWKSDGLVHWSGKMLLFSAKTIM